MIFYYYSKLVIAPSADLPGNYGFIIDRYKALQNGEISMSDYDRELFHKETDRDDRCAYCGAETDLTRDHVVPQNTGGPSGMHTVVWVCEECNSSKGARDLVQWWNDRFGESRGEASDALPRVPAGIYLKLCYDWHKVNHSLETAARSLSDLAPFQ